MRVNADDFSTQSDVGQSVNPLVPRPIDLYAEVPLDGAAPLEDLDNAKIFGAPADPKDRAAWRSNLRRWCTEARQRLGYDGQRYDRSVWTESCYAVGLLWLWDEQLYDAATGEFTPELMVAAARTEFGGFDAVVLWHAYPVIGIDDRNQWDYYREVAGLAGLIDRFHELGVKVFLDYNPWDTGTRRTGFDDATELATLVKDFGADGIFLDTLKEADRSLFAALDEVDPELALEGESRLPLTRIEDHTLSWAQWFADTDTPGVLRSRWFEPRHMQHHTRRWNRDHSDELQSAWINGAGMLIWECVFGAWVGWNARDRATLRSMTRVQRAAHDLLIRGEWTPLCDEVTGPDVYAASYRLDRLTLLTLINRADEPRSARISASGQLHELNRGAAITDGQIVVPARGIAGVLTVGGEDPEWLAELMVAAAADQGSGDSSFPQRVARRSEPGLSAGSSITAGMAHIVGGTRDLTVRYRRRETGFYGGAPYVEEWKPLPPRLHDWRSEQHRIELDQMAIDTWEVSNGEFYDFITETAYVPAISAHFLEHWLDGKPESPDEPVTFVDLDDARAYASWAGKRLPTEFEWQAGAEDGVLDRRTPRVWNWTESEHSDGRTRYWFAKGGSDFKAVGSEWYVDGGVCAPEVSVRMLMLGGGLSRSARVGFRCVVDLR